MPSAVSLSDDMRSQKVIASDVDGASLQSILRLCRPLALISASIRVLAPAREPSVMRHVVMILKIGRVVGTMRE